MGRGEHRRNRSALGRRKDRGALGPGRVHHGEQIVGERLERRHVGGREPVGTAPSAAVGDDHAGVLGQAPQEP
jgi:hypothetical protein